MPCTSLQLHRFTAPALLCTALVDVLEQELRHHLSPGATMRPLGLATGRTMEPLYAALVARLQGWSGPDRQRLRAVWCSYNLDEYLGLKAGDARSYRQFMTE
ncbi:MAG: glucosamine-6-phosphate deaminase, partial [Synechococcus sp.]|nr:glucosamine-6-phosphate deaminase [Synechococcus sp.]